MSTWKFIALMMGIILFSACSKKESSFSEKDSIVYLKIVDEDGKPVGGLPVLVFDENGYEKFKKNESASPLGMTFTLVDGQATYRLPFLEWFTSGNREVAFVVKEEKDPGNYRVWAIRRTIGASERVQIELKLDKGPEIPSGILLDLFDENNGRTLFGNAVYMDGTHHLVGGDRYSFVDAGTVAGLNGIGDLRLEKFVDKMEVQPQHGYWVCKDISLMEFPSGKWGMAISAEYAKIYMDQWLLQDRTIVGARFHYSMHQSVGSGLPEWGQSYSLKVGSSTSIPLPLGASDCECTAHGNVPFRFIFGKDEVTIQVIDPMAVPGKEYRFYIRSGVYYTEAKVRIV